ncbi:hypothetical protein F5Y16DRAFT_400131 [Xylariaceae sp. FL0255]|nr:hypothetical protein F5Y16DRAFT_400131 [Xylariaceae sp. FL0255]
MPQRQDADSDASVDRASASRQFENLNLLKSFLGDDRKISTASTTRSPPINPPKIRRRPVPLPGSSSDLARHSSNDARTQDQRREPANPLVPNNGLAEEDRNVNTISKTEPPVRPPSVPNYPKTNGLGIDQAYPTELKRPNCSAVEGPGSTSHRSQTDPGKPFKGGLNALFQAPVRLEPVRPGKPGIGHSTVDQGSGSPSVSGSIDGHFAPASLEQRQMSPDWSARSPSSNSTTSDYPVRPLSSWHQRARAYLALSQSSPVGVYELPASEPVVTLSRSDPLRITSAPHLPLTDRWLSKLSASRVQADYPLVCELECSLPAAMESDDSREDMDEDMLVIDLESAILAEPGTSSAE